jgi:hypothetical protein
MDMADFEEKIRRRNMDIASPLEAMDFPSDDEDVPQTPTEEVPGETYNSISTPRQDESALEELEGDRRNARSRQPLTPGPSQTAQAEKKKKPAISMTEVQYCQLRNADEDDNEEGMAGFEISSSELSEEDDSSSGFDADDDYFADLAARQVEQAKLKAQGESKKEKLKVANEADMEKLMLMPVKDLRPKKAEETIEDDDKSLSAQRRKSEKAKVAAKKQDSATTVRDPRFATNVLPVRRALREAYRNLPFTDFIAFINFLLRGLKRIKHVSSARELTYWHSDDPVVSHLMGELNQNPYPSDVLRAMGFVQLFDVYWMWPDKHLRIEGVNIKRLVPAHCPGLEKLRLDDLIKLVTQCRKNLEKYGKGFDGHITQG